MPHETCHARQSALCGGGGGQTAAGGLPPPGDGAFGGRPAPPTRHTYPIQAAMEASVAAVEWDAAYAPWAHTDPAISAR